jgi:tRNA pseudouridine38-40 synthase
MLKSSKEKNYRFIISYNGSRFCGFQYQDNAPTIEQEIIKAIKIITKQNVKLVVAGRTDSGVHAHHQVFSCVLITDISLAKLTLGINAVLPHDIAITRIDIMPMGFNARNHSIGKQYIYLIWQGIGKSPFFHERSLHVKHKLDVDAMEKACKFLVGEHDFSSFRSKACMAKHAKRFIWHIRINKDDALIKIDIRGNAFCFNMVRIIVGTLIEVGLYKRTIDSVLDALKSLDRRKAGVTAKPHGLSLNKVYYPDDIKDADIPPDVSFPRYPINDISWPFKKEDIEIGPVILFR